MRRRLKVYMPFLENQFKRNLAYKGSFYLFILTSLFGPFISYYLWSAIYGSSGGGMLGGLTQSEMIIYVFMSYVTSSLVTVGVSDAISDDVMEGTVAMTLIKPIDYRMRLIFMALGEALYRFLAPVIFVWIGLEIYKAAVLGLGVTPVINILLYILSVIMSIFIHLLFDFCFGMVAFVTTYMFGMNMAKEALLGFLSGQLIPISFFPQVLQQIFEFLPFSSMIYVPVMVYLGKYSGMELAFVLGRQLLWIVLLYAFGSYLWSRITKRLIVLGG
ncbi:MAG: ABC-2 family transporter protein [Lachnospiraceae bacterium]|nr:ABC-2 family transporter protein [Lachnospiraceae bacterium]